jgi:heme-degrading monooxygenase HmoA
MIARLWTARAAVSDAPAYRAHVEQRVLPALRAVEGYQGATLLTRARREHVEILVITWWSSLDAIRGFAGSDLERAVVADEVRPLLAAWDDRVRHYEVALADEP